MSYTLGSLFDGSGGFPLAGTLCGIEPVWASEVEPYPIAVTRSRFPDMKHLGDISKISGGKIDPVDIITFGSPCQDLSVAGKRAGLKHEANGDEETTRSGLFMEAVRIIKEMRVATGGEYPRWALWENVPGAFSSSKGEDFRAVCEELIKIIEPGAVMPAVPKNGWPYADSYCGDGWSLAYRVLDAQFWGVPQRRRRIHLVLDLTGQRAGEVLFEREGLRGYFAEGRSPWQGPASHAERGSGADDREGDRVGTFAIVDSVGGQAERGWMGCTIPTLKATHYKCPPLICVPAAGFCTEHSEHSRSIGYQEECAPTLRAGVTPATVYSIENHPADSRVNIDDSGKVQCLTSRMGTGGGNVPLIMEQKPVICLQGNAVDRDVKQNGLGCSDGAMYSLNTVDRHAVAYGVDCRNGNEYPELYPTLQAKPNGGQSLNFSGALRTRYIVRRLTPTECARLQGFPDTWGHPDLKDELTAEEFAFWRDVRNTHAEINGKPVKDYTNAQMLKWYNGLHTDSSEYKMWGNGIALPTALYVMQGIADALGAEPVSAAPKVEVPAPKKRLVISLNALRKSRIKRKKRRGGANERL